MSDVAGPVLTITDLRVAIAGTQILPWHRPVSDERTNPGSGR